jgi:hypothetical protein
MNLQSRYITALLRDQTKVTEAPANARLPCPYPQRSGMTIMDHLFGHAKDEHRDETQEPLETHAKLLK